MIRAFLRLTPSINFSKLLKTLPHLAATVIAILISTPAQAEMREMKGNFAIGASLLTSVPIGEYNEVLNLGIGAEFTGEYYLSNHVSLGLGVGGVVNRISDQFSAPSVDERARLFTFSAFGRFVLPKDSLEPYLLAVAGATNRSLIIFDPLSNMREEIGEQRSRLSAAGGLGAILNTDQSIDFLGEVRYVVVFVDETARFDVGNQSSVEIILGLRLILD